MKCKYCGNNLNIEDKYCPYCGKANPFAKKHQQEMDRFARDYEETKQDVLEESSRFNRKTVRITIIAVLVALIAVAFILVVKADDIRYWQEDRAIETRADEHSANIESLMADRDYTAVYHYMNDNHLTYSRALRKYDAVYDTSFRYNMFYENLMTLQLKKADSEKYRYYTDTELIEDISKNIHSVYEFMTPQEYNKEAYEGECMEYMEDLRDEVEILTAGYFGLTMEEARSMREMNQARINVFLEDHYEG